MLVKDPYSLNIEVPLQAENMIRNRLREALPEVVQNKNLRPLFDMVRDGAEGKLVQDLMNLNPFNGRLAHYLYTLSDVAKVETMIGKFANSRSVRTILVQSGGTRLTATDFVSSIEKIDRRGVKHYKKRLQENEPKTLAVLLGTSERCTYRIFKLLRHRTWGVEVTGVTMPAPSEQTALSRYSVTTDVGNSILYVVEPIVHPVLIRGPMRPYLGSRTSARTKKSSLEVVTTDPMDLRKLAQIEPWACSSTSENLKELITVMIQEKTMIGIGQLEQIAPQIVGGSISHRLQDTSSPLGAMSNTLYTVFTYIKIVTDAMYNHSKSSKDYNICFQAVNLMNLMRLKLLLAQGGVIRGNWAGSLVCCTEEVFEGAYDLSQPPQYLGVPFGNKVESIIVQVRGRQTETVALPCSQEAAAIYGYKWATAISHSMSGTGEVPSFVNLTEMCRLDIEFMIGVIALRLLVKHKGCVNATRRSITVPSSSAGVKSLARSIIKADRVGSLSAICDFEPPTGVDDVTGVLRLCLFTMVGLGHRLEKYNHLPNNVTERAINNQNSVMFPVFGPDSRTQIVRQEVEVFSEVRSLAKASVVGNVPLMTDMFNPATRSGISIKHKTVLGSSSCAIVGTQTTFVSDLSTFADKLVKPTNLYTIQDPCGEMYCFLKHLFPDSGGFPFQSFNPRLVKTDEDVHLAISSIAKDECDIAYDKDSTLKMAITGEYISPRPYQGDLVVCGGLLGDEFLNGAHYILQVPVKKPVMLRGVLLSHLSLWGDYVWVYGDSSKEPKSHTFHRTIMSKGLLNREDILAQFGRQKHKAMCRCLGRIPATLGAKGCNTLDVVEVSRTIWVNICTNKDTVSRLLWEFVETHGQQGDIAALRKFGRSGHLNSLLTMIGQSLARLRLMAFSEPALHPVEVHTHKRTNTRQGLMVCWNRQCEKLSKIHSVAVDPVSMEGDVYVWWALAHGHRNNEWILRPGEITKVLDWGCDSD